MGWNDDPIIGSMSGSTAVAEPPQPAWAKDPVIGQVPQIRQPAPPQAMPAPAPSPYTPNPTIGQSYNPDVPMMGMGGPAIPPAPPQIDYASNRYAKAYAQAQQPRIDTADPNYPDYAQQQARSSANISGVYDAGKAVRDWFERHRDKTMPDPNDYFPSEALQYLPPQQANFFREQYKNQFTRPQIEAAGKSIPGGYIPEHLLAGVAKAGALGSEVGAGLIRGAGDLVAGMPITEGAKQTVRGWAGAAAAPQQQAAQGYRGAANTIEQNLPQTTGAGIATGAAKMAGMIGAGFVNPAAFPALFATDAAAEAHAAAKNAGRSDTEAAGDASFAGIKAAIIAKIPMTVGLAVKDSLAGKLAEMAIVGGTQNVTDTFTQLKVERLLHGDGNLTAADWDQIIQSFAHGAIAAPIMGGGHMAVNRMRQGKAQPPPPADIQPPPQPPRQPTGLTGGRPTQRDVFAGQPGERQMTSLSGTTPPDQVWDQLPPQAQPKPQREVIEQQPPIPTLPDQVSEQQYDPGDLAGAMRGVTERQRLANERLKKPTGATHDLDFKGAFSLGKNGITDTYIDAFWGRVERGEAIPRMGKLENQLRDAQKAGTIKSREDVAAIVNAYGKPKPADRPDMKAAYDAGLNGKDITETDPAVVKAITPDIIDAHRRGIADAKKAKAAADEKNVLDTSIDKRLLGQLEAALKSGDETAINAAGKNVDRHMKFIDDNNTAFERGEDRLDRLDGIQAEIDRLVETYKGAADANAQPPRETQEQGKLRRQREIGDAWSEQRRHLQIFDVPIADTLKDGIEKWVGGTSGPPSRVKGTESGKPFQNTEKGADAAERRAQKLADETGVVHSVLQVRNGEDVRTGIAIVESPNIKDGAWNPSNTPMFTWDSQLGKIGSVRHFFPKGASNDAQPPKPVPAQAQDPSRTTAQEPPAGGSRGGGDAPLAQTQVGSPKADAGGMETKTGRVAGGAEVSKEFIANAAIKNKSTGEIFVGKDHPEAYGKAGIDVESPDIQFNRSLKNFEDGFVTGEGRFVDRKEGLAIAKKAQEIRPGSDKVKLPSGEVKDAGILHGDSIVRDADGRPKLLAAPVEGEAGRVAGGANAEGARVNRAVDDYHNGNIDTIHDLVNRVDEIASETNNQRLIDAVEKFRKEYQDSEKLKGRGDMDQVEAEFLAAIGGKGPSLDAPTSAGGKTFAEKAAELKAMQQRGEITAEEFGKAITVLGTKAEGENPTIQKMLAKPQQAIQREPWQMTREEYGNKLRSENPKKKYTDKQIEDFHRASLRVVMEGPKDQRRPVPPEVLKDYPDLQKGVPNGQENQAKAQVLDTAPANPPKGGEAGKSELPRVRDQYVIPGTERAVEEAMSREEFEGKILRDNPGIDRSQIAEIRADIEKRAADLAKESNDMADVVEGISGNFDLANGKGYWIPTRLAEQLAGRAVAMARAMGTRKPLKRETNWEMTREERSSRGREQMDDVREMLTPKQEEQQAANAKLVKKPKEEPAPVAKKPEPIDPAREVTVEEVSEAQKEWERTRKVKEELRLKLASMGYGSKNYRKTAERYDLAQHDDSVAYDRIKTLNDQYKKQQARAAESDPNPIKAAVAKHRRLVDERADKGEISAAKAKAEEVVAKEIDRLTDDAVKAETDGAGKLSKADDDAAIAVAKNEATEYVMGAINAIDKLQERFSGYVRGARLKKYRDVKQAEIDKLAEDAGILYSSKSRIYEDYTFEGIDKKVEEAKKYLAEEKKNKQAEKEKEREGNIARANELQDGEPKATIRSVDSIASAPGHRFMTDGKWMIDTKAVGKSPMIAKLNLKKRTGRAISDEAVDDVWSKARDGAKDNPPLEDLGYRSVSKEVGRGSKKKTETTHYRYYADAEGNLHAADAEYVSLLKEATGFDSIRASGDHRMPLVIYKGKKPVGVLMPINPEKSGVDVATARARKQPKTETQSAAAPVSKLDAPRLEAVGEKMSVVKMPRDKRSVFDGDGLGLMYNLKHEGYVVPPGKRKAVEAELAKMQAADVPADPDDGGVSGAPSNAFRQPKNMVGGSEPTVNPREIIKQVEAMTGTPVRTGHGKFAQRKAAGWFNRKTDVIRNKVAEQLDVAYHEAGHSIHDKVIGWKAPWPAGVAQELQAMGRELYGNRKPNGGYRREGMAEYVAREMLGDPDLATVAPKTKEWMEKTILPAHPEFAKQYAKLKEMASAWNDQGAVARVAAKINKLDRGLVSVAKNAYESLSKMLSPFSWTNDAHHLEKAQKRLLSERNIKQEDLPIKFDPARKRQALKMTAPGTARYFIENAAVNTSYEKVGPSLKDALKPVVDDLGNFVTYAYARRSVDLHKRGINPGISSEDANYTVKELETPEFKAASDALTTWSNHLIDYVVDSGGLSRESADAIRKLNPVYLPLKRYFDETQLGGGGGGSARGLVNQGSAVKAIKGSGRSIVDPLESLALQAEHMITLGNKARVARSIVDLADIAGKAGWFAEKVDLNKQGQSFTVESVAKQLEDIGADMSQVDLDKLLTVFSQPTRYTGKDNIVSIWRDGKQEFWELHPDVYRAVTEMDKDSIPSVLRFLTVPARVVRLGATALRPAFQLSNMVKDAFTASIYGKGVRTPLASVRGIVADWAGKPEAERWKAAGGGMGTIMGQDRVAARRSIEEMMASGAKEKAIQYAKHPVDAVRAAFEAGEAGPRIEEFRRVYADAEKKYGAGSESAALEALLASKEITVDFTRQGMIGAIANQFIPFFNARIQGTSRLYREFSNPSRAIPAIAKAMAWVTLPSVALWMMNKDEEWYKELPSHERANYWHFSVNGGKTIWKVPVPESLGKMFGTTPVAAIDAAYQKDPKRVSDGVFELVKSFVPISSPTELVSAYLKPTLESSMNYDGWRDRPIVPHHLEERKLPKDQFGKYTTETGKKIGEWLNVSPMKVEHMISGYSGGLAMDIIRRIESAANIRKSLPGEGGISGRFVARDPIGQGYGVERFYDKLKEERQKKGSSKLKSLELEQLERVAKRISGIRDEIDMGRISDERGRRAIQDLVRGVR